MITATGIRLGNKKLKKHDIPEALRISPNNFSLTKKVSDHHPTHNLPAVLEIPDNIAPKRIPTPEAI